MGTREDRCLGALGRDTKGRVSLALYLAAIPLAFVREWIADALYVAVALIWLVPDPRLESHDARKRGPAIEPE